MENRALAELTRATIETLKHADFPLLMPGTIELTESRKMLLTQLQTRLLPQFEAAAFPALVVFGGSSGAGKSTLVNSLLGEEITPASIIRPTTTTPILVAHPDDAVAVQQHPLAKFAKVMICDSAISGIALVDAPDLDTINEANQEISRRLLESADLWIFTTTAARYGDAKAWQTLELANQRGLTCAVVLNRLPEQTKDAIVEDIRKRLITSNLAGTPLFTVADFSPMQGLLTGEAVAELKHWLVLLAQTQLSETIAARTTSAVIPALRTELLILADGLEAQANARTDLRDKAVEASAHPLEKLVNNVRAGRFGQGAASASWLALASSGGPLAQMVAANGAKPKMLQATKQKKQVRDAAFITLFDVLVTGAQAAVLQAILATRERVETEWENDVVDTAEFVASARKKSAPEDYAKEALGRWKSALRSLGSNCRQHTWLTANGNAALIGAAAGGISGAAKLAAALGLEEDVRQARKVLAASATQSVEKLLQDYLMCLDEVQIPDATALKLRAAEFADRV